MANITAQMVKELRVSKNDQPVEFVFNDNTNLFNTFLLIAYFPITALDLLFSEAGIKIIRMWFNWIRMAEEGETIIKLYSII